MTKQSCAGTFLKDRRWCTSMMLWTPRAKVRLSSWANYVLSISRKNNHYSKMIWRIFIMLLNLAKTSHGYSSWYIDYNPVGWCVYLLIMKTNGSTLVFPRLSLAFRVCVRSERFWSLSAVCASVSSGPWGSSAPSSHLLTQERYSPPWALKALIQITYPEGSISFVKCLTHPLCLQ